MNNLVNTKILAQILNGDMNDQCPIEFEFYSSLEILAYSRFGLKDILETTTNNGKNGKSITLTELLNKYCSDSKSFVESIFYTIFNTPKLLDKNYNPIQSFELQRSGYEEKYSRLASFLSQKLTINIDSRGNIITIINMPNVESKIEFSDTIGIEAFLNDKINDNKTTPQDKSIVLVLLGKILEYETSNFQKHLKRLNYVEIQET